MSDKPLQIDQLRLLSVCSDPILREAADGLVKALMLLKSLEWSGDAAEYPACPSCGRPRYDPLEHEADCHLNEILVRHGVNT
jgi:4-hydroxy-3-methylbut-2-en-1-yl diphosphate synthase IspG/GcpE